MAEMHGTAECVGAEFGAHCIESNIERCVAAAVECQRELHGIFVAQVGQGNTDEREAFARDATLFGRQ